MNIGQLHSYLIERCSKDYRNDSLRSKDYRNDSLPCTLKAVRSVHSYTCAYVKGVVDGTGE